MLPTCDSRHAGGLATYLSGECRIDGQDAAAAGWLARARRLLSDAGTVPEAGWLAIEEAKRAAEPAESEERARAARVRRSMRVVPGFPRLRFALGAWR